MGILAWIVLGAIAAWLEQQLLPRGPRSSFVGSMVLAFAGAMLGNLLAYSLGYGDISGFNARSVLISAAGIVVILAVYRVIQQLVLRNRPEPPARPRV
jgi:uncharacterized membrane protein YeaQ/YmgE (transglycosylase-associated protein family)